MFYNCTYISHRMGFFKVGLWFSSESTSLNVTFWVQNKKNVFLSLKFLKVVWRSWLYSWLMLFSFNWEQTGFLFKHFTSWKAFKFLTKDTSLWAKIFREFAKVILSKKKQLDLTVSPLGASTHLQHAPFFFPLETKKVCSFTEAIYHSKIRTTLHIPDP